MLAFGILGLFGIGIAMSMGGDDDLEVETTEQSEDNADDVSLSQTTDTAGYLEPVGPVTEETQEQSQLFAAPPEPAATEQEYDNTTRNALIQGYVKIGEVDAETQDRIDSYLDGMDPSQPIDEAAADYETFVTSLGVELLEPTAEEAEPQVFNDPEPQVYNNELRNALLLEYVPVEAPDAETQAQIDAFLQNLPTQQNIHDAALEFRNFAAGLGLEVPEGSDGSAPPMGDDYRDPLVIAEELAAQAEEARQPHNLVTVSDADGQETDDGEVLAENDTAADPDAPGFVVTAPEGENTIDVGFDAEHTFHITYNAETTAITAGLNSSIEGPDGGLEREITNATDDNGVNVRTLTWAKQFSHSTDITINVAADHIGTQTGQIDLSNPNDSVHFDFDTEMTGDIHLVFYESPENNDSDSSTTKRAFVIHNENTGVGAPTAADVAALLEAGGPINGVNILSEIYLGEDSVDINGDPEDGEPYEVLITNFINESPQISSNIDWTSVTAADEDSQTGNQNTGSGGGDDGEGNSGGGNNGEDDIREMLTGIGLNPAFFGF